MKRILLLSTFVLTQSIFATTLTIYNSNIALVQESQAFHIEQKEQELNYDAIPKTIISDSLSVDFPNSVQLRSQAYEQGHKHRHNDLRFDITSKKEFTADIAISYLANNISFYTDYTLNLHNNSADITAWVDIQNNSGKDFKNASVKLIAGDIHRAYAPQPLTYRTNRLTASKALVPHKAVHGYYKYTLPFTLDINTNETRRVKLFEQNKLTLHNSFTARMNNPLYLMGERSSKVNREIELSNLHHTLPTGLVRIYTQDEGDKLLLGEAHIDNMPKNTPLHLSVGRDFDTQVKQTLRSRKDTQEAFDVTVAYEIENHSNEDKIITMQIPFNKKAGSKITSKLKYAYTKGNLVTFTLKIKANSKRDFEVNFQSKRR